MVLQFLIGSFGKTCLAGLLCVEGRGKVYRRVYFLQSRIVSQLGIRASCYLYFSTCTAALAVAEISFPKTIYDDFPFSVHLFA